MDPTILAQLVVFGLLLGSIYGLVALGLTMIWGVMNIINVAHGAFMVVGMYTVWYITNATGLGPLFGIVAAVGLLFGLGIVIQRMTIAPFEENAAFNGIIVTIGWLLILVATIQILFSSTPRGLDTDLGTYEILGVFLPGGRLLGLLVTVSAVVILMTFFRFTRLGRAIRATADNRESAKYVGIEVTRIDSLAFGIGAALAGLAGAVIPFIQRFDPYLGNFFLVTAFVVAVLGGLGSFWGAFLGGIIVGLVQVFGSYYLPGSTHRILVFVVFILVLLIRPSGLSGRESHV